MKTSDLLIRPSGSESPPQRGSFSPAVRKHRGDDFLELHPRMADYFLTHNIRTAGSLLSLLTAARSQVAIVFGWDMEEIENASAELRRTVAEFLPGDLLKAVEGPVIQHATGHRLKA